MYNEKKVIRCCEKLETLAENSSTALVFITYKKDDGSLDAHRIYKGDLRQSIAELISMFQLNDLMADQLKHLFVDTVLNLALRDEDVKDAVMRVAEEIEDNENE